MVAREAQWLQRNTWSGDGGGVSLSHTCRLHLWMEKNSLHHNHCPWILGKSNKVSSLTYRWILALFRLTAFKSTFSQRNSKIPAMGKGAGVGYVKQLRKKTQTVFLSVQLAETRAAVPSGTELEGKWLPLCQWAVPAKGRQLSPMCPWQESEDSRHSSECQLLSSALTGPHAPSACWTAKPGSSTLSHTGPGCSRISQALEHCSIGFYAFT